MIRESYLCPYLGFMVDEKKYEWQLLFCDRKRKCLKSREK